MATKTTTIVTTPPKTTTMTTTTKTSMVMTQAEMSRTAAADPGAFWLAAATRLVEWATPPDCAYGTPKTTTPKEGKPPKETAKSVWFPGGTLNTCHNALDRHVARGPHAAARPALVWDAPLAHTRAVFTYADLLARVKSLAAVLRHRLGVTKGSTVIIYMSMVPEAVFAMLACARIGAIHSVVFGGFASLELAKRIEDCKPVAILATSCGIEPNRVVPHKPLLDAAVALCTHRPKWKLVLQRPQQGDDVMLDATRGELDWKSEVDNVVTRGWPLPEPESMRSEDPLYLIYTSGSTGKPKGVVRDHGGHAVAMHWSMENVFGLREGDVMFTTSDIGWVLGHSYIVYGPLIAGCTTILYEGKPVGTPDAGAFWHVISEYGAKVFFTSPTAMRSIKREDPDGVYVKRYAMPKLRQMFIAGERLDTDTHRHFERQLGISVRDNYWQSETGWPITATCVIDAERRFSTKVRAGSAGMAVPGYRVSVLVAEQGEDHEENADLGGDAKIRFREARVGETGNLAVQMPLPPGCLTGLWGHADGVMQVYGTRFPGYFDLMDAGYVDADGYVYVMSRTDDVLNVSGRRLSAGAIEEAVAGHSAVAECAVVGAIDSSEGRGGERPVAFVVLKRSLGEGGDQRTRTRSEREDLAREVDGRVRAAVGAVAGVWRVVEVTRLPKTRSGKVLRRTLRILCHSSDAVGAAEGMAVPATIEDARAIAEAAEALVRSNTRIFRAPRREVCPSKL